MSLRGGWMSSEAGESLPEAYSRVTNPERFEVLHSTMLAILDRLEADFDVRREEGHGLDEELERKFDLARPSIRLTPADPEAAPVTVAFPACPGLHLRFGLWWKEPAPSCGCDACDESGEQLAEQLTELIEDVVAGRFWESHNPARRWQEGKIWGGHGIRGHGDPGGEDSFSRRRKRGHRILRGEDSSKTRRVDWKPWPRRDNGAP